MEKLVNINIACEGLKEGKTLLYPTDTVWGIGCDINNEEAVNKIYKIKKRAQDKSFILLVESVAMLERYIRNIPDVCYDLIDLTEKPLTIIYETPTGLPPYLLAADGSIGIRVTTDPNCRKLIQALRRPLVSTSANVSGEPPATCFKEINEDIKSGVDLILHKRMDEIMRTPSSIIMVGENGKVKVIR